LKFAGRKGALNSDAFTVSARSEDILALRGGRDNVSVVLTGII
jgi:hypothetical protein